MKSETILQNKIRVTLCERGHFCDRTNTGIFYTKDGRAIRIGEKGQSDLRGHRGTDGKAFYLETKTDNGKPSKEQILFIEAMKRTNAIAGIVKSVEEAISLIEKR